MARTKEKLSRAKNAKNDEFYTQWSDIEKEVNAYIEYDKDVFRGKTILLPADDPFESNFFKYFATHNRKRKWGNQKWQRQFLTYKTLV